MIVGHNSPPVDDGQQCSSGAVTAALLRPQSVPFAVLKGLHLNTRLIEAHGPAAQRSLRATQTHSGRRRFPTFSFLQIPPLYFKARLESDAPLLY